MPFSSLLFIFLNNPFALGFLVIGGFAAFGASLFNRRVQRVFIILTVVLLASTLAILRFLFAAFAGMGGAHLTLSQDFFFVSSFLVFTGPWFLLDLAPVAKYRKWLRLILVIAIFPAMTMIFKWTSLF